MADIDVVRKRHSSLWVWALLAVVAAVVLLAYFAMRDDTTRTNRAVSRVLSPTLTLAAPAIATPTLA